MFGKASAKIDDFEGVIYRPKQVKPQPGQKKTKEAKKIAKLDDIGE